MKRIGVFCDISNLYYCLKRQYHEKKLSYVKYVEFITVMGQIQQLSAYGSNEQRALRFVNRLRDLGFAIKYKNPKTVTDNGTLKRKANCDIWLAIDIVQMIDRLDMVILGSGDGDFAPLISWCRSRGVDVIVLACNISFELKEVATKCIEIPESFLEERYGDNDDNE